eukprot:NODE_96_length_20709_cov_1.429161.p2 type:complete len:698 gc:universal NODE_96_length_20709_cov_1.429161:8827-6734(-)
MGVSSVVEILMMNAQFLSVAAGQDIAWPDEYKGYVQFLQFFNFDFTVGLKLFNIDQVDIRTQHLFISHVVPILISLTILFSFRSVFTILKYTLTAVCFFGFIFGLIIKLLGGQTSDISGILIMVLCGFVLFLIAISHYFQKRRQKKKVQEKINTAVGSTVNLDADEIDLEKFKYLKGLKFVHKKSFWRQLRNLLLGFVLFTIGLASFGANGQIYGLLVIFGLVLMYNVISNMSSRGRNFNTKLNYAFRKDVVKIILIFMSLLYVPITISAFKMILGSNYVQHEQCENGILKMKMPFQPYTGGSDGCIPMFNVSTTASNFTNLGLAKNINFEDELFFRADKTITYHSDILQYFSIGVVLMFILITIGMPLLFYKLTKTCSKFIVEIPVICKDPENQWIVRATGSKNCCKSLYCMFQLKWKNYKLIYLIYRLLIVCISALIGISRDGARPVFISLTVVHFVALCITTYSRPYISSIEDIVSIVCNSLQVLNAVIFTLFSFNVPVPTKLAIPVITLTMILPIAAIFLGLYIESRKEKEMKKDMEHHHKLTQRELEEMGPEGDFTKKKVHLAQYLNIEAKELQNMDMVIDKKLQDILVLYFFILAIGCGISLTAGMIDINNPPYTYKLASAHHPDTPVQDLNGFTTTEREYCKSLSKTLANECRCVNISGVLVNGLREVWKCNSTLQDTLIVIIANLDIKA